MVPSFARNLAAHGDKPALILPGGKVSSYADLARESAEFASRLPARKQLVAIEAATELSAIAAYLGSLAEGHAVALLPAGDRSALENFRARFRPDAVFRRQAGEWLLSYEASGEPAPHPELALVLMTSGSTGHGKAVRLSGRAVEANAEAIGQYLELGADDRAALVLPLHYSYGLSVLNSHLAAGASLWLHSGSVLDSGFLDGLRCTGCTGLAGVPHTYDLLERIGLREADLPRLQTMTVAGGALAAPMVRRYHAHLAARGGRFFVMYGQTEATARIAYLPPSQVGVAPDRIGVAIPGGLLSLRAEDGRAVEAAETVGELVYRGPNVMMGYGGSRADLSRPAEIDELRTGDLAVRDAAGLYRIVGRLRRMSKIAGLRVGHDALEAALAADGVTAAVFGDDERLVAAYTSRQDPEAVAERMAETARLTRRHVAAFRVAELPRLASGKVDYETFRASAVARPSNGGIVEAFRQCFHPLPVRPTDSFAGLAGDSLRHVELTMELERHLGRVPEGWEHMRLAELSRLRPERTPADGIGSELLVRALAILAVVVQHQTGWAAYGGSAALIGYGLARFQREALAAWDHARFFRPLWRVLVPYYLILCGYALAWGQMPWASVFLVGNFGLADPVDHDMLPYLYWFVEVYVQLMLVVAALFLAPPLRDLALRAPFRFGLALLGSAMLARLIGPEVWPLEGRQIFTLPWVFYLCAFGWCAATADTPGRKLMVLVGAAAVMPTVAWLGGNWFGSWIKYSAQFAVVATLLYFPRVRMPGWAARGVLEIAQASLFIYLLHRFVPELLMLPIQAALPPALFDALAVLGGLGLGIAAAALQRRVLRHFRQLARMPGHRPSGALDGSVA